LFTGEHVSRSLPQLQQQAQERAEEFCARYVKPRRSKGRKTGSASSGDTPAKRPQARPDSFYRPRDHEASPFFQVVRECFDEFERTYPERYQKGYGYWRPVIRTSIEKFVKCGDLKEGFARIRCPDCHKEFFVAFSCRQRACCPSCDQKRALLLALRLNGEVFDGVPHRQWVFTVPKRLRVYFRYDRKLLGELCRAAYGTVCDVLGLEVDGSKGVPAMVGAVQTFGDLLNWHPHIHAVVAEGVFGESGEFVPLAKVQKHRAADFWQERVFNLLLDAHKMDEQTVGSMRGWKHSGFGVDSSVRISANDLAGMSRLLGYIARCPLSLARMITRTADGKIVYRASHANCWAFPKSGEQTVMEGISRNFEVFEPLDFLAEVTQHIPDRGEHQIRYYGHYSNKSRGIRRKALRAVVTPKPPQQLTAQQLRFRLTWAALIKLVYEVDPLKCPDCGGTMKVVALIDHGRQPDVVEKILRHCSLWREPKQRAPPCAAAAPPQSRVRELTYDPGYFDRECA
jgi:hypothetical protein